MEISNSITLHFLRVRPVKLPERGTTTSAGIDFFVPAFYEEFITDFETKNPDIKLSVNYTEDGHLNGSGDFVLEPHQRANIPSGVKAVFDRDQAASALIAYNKSGVSTKKGLCKMAEVVDSDYRGEIHISLVNTSNEPVVIKAGEKLMQFLHIPVYLSQIHEINQDEFDAYGTTERGEGGFGHTGDK